MNEHTMARIQGSAPIASPDLDVGGAEARADGEPVEGARTKGAREKEYEVEEWKKKSVAKKKLN